MDVMASPGSSHTRLGAKLRQLRTERGLSVRTLAARSGFSPSFISQVEVDAVSPSIASLEKIVNQLGVTLGQFFSAMEAAPRTVVRRAERAVYDSGWSRSSVEALTDAAPGRKVSVVQVTAEPGGLSGKRPEATPQDTIVLVLAGAVTLTTDAESLTLAAGDTAYLAQGTPFNWENRGEERATLLIVGATGSGELMGDLAAVGKDNAVER
jgi:transcriptional regulator with XRE-family HTH domain